MKIITYTLNKISLHTRVCIFVYKSGTIFWDIALHFFLFTEQLIITIFSCQHILIYVSNFFFNHTSITTLFLKFFLWREGKEDCREKKFRTDLILFLSLDTNMSSLAPLRLTATSSLTKLPVTIWNIYADSSHKCRKTSFDLLLIFRTCVVEK